MKEIEVRELTINEQGDLGVSAVAFVDRPAIQVDFHTFNDVKKYEFNEERRIVSGVAMIPDMPIYRNDSSGEYYVKFSKDTIEQIAVKFFKENNHINVNEMHNADKMVSDVLLFESFIVDSKRGVNAPTWNADAIDGTWVMSYKVFNDGVWQGVKDGRFKGFSVEGLFENTTLGKENQNDIENELEDVLGKFLNTFNSNSIIGITFNKNMSKVKQAFDALKALLSDTEQGTQTFTDVTLKDGSIIQVDTEELAVGSMATLVTDQKTMPLPDGTYELEDGRSFIVLEGKVTEIVMPVEQGAEEKPKEEAMNYQPQIDELKKSIADLIGANLASNQKMGEQIKALVTVVELMSNEVKEPATESRNNFASAKKQEKFNELKEAFKQLKK